MKVTTYEAMVVNGQIQLSEPVRLPEHTKVYVLVPAVGEGTVVHVGSPRLANPKQAADFTMDVTEGSSDAGLCSGLQSAGTCGQSPLATS